MSNIDGIQRQLLQELPVDCLLHIIKYLRLNDRLRLALAINHFYDFIPTNLSAELFDYEDFKNFCTLEEAEKLLSRYGSQVERLNFGEDNGVPVDVAYFNLFLKYCKNLKEIHICDSMHLDLVKNCSSSLTILKIKSQNFGDYHCKLIGKLKKLQRLEIQRRGRLRDRDRVTISGRYLTNLKTLTDLRVGYCEEFQPQHLIEICRNNRLTRLDIYSCLQLDSVSFWTVLRPQSKSLEYLAMSSHTNVLVQLKCLRHLEFHHKGHPHNNIQLFLNIVEYCKDRLETFRIFYEPYPMERFEDGFKCICQLVNLKSLEIFTETFPLEYLGRLADNCRLLEKLKLWNVSPAINEATEEYIRGKLPKLKEFVHCEKSEYYRAPWLSQEE